MKTYLRINKDGKVLSLATLRCNLHETGEKTTDVVTEIKFRPGDVFKNGKREKHPENYPQKTQAEKNEDLIKAKIAEKQRNEAIAELKQEGRLTADFK